MLDPLLICSENDKRKMEKGGAPVDEERSKESP